VVVAEGNGNPRRRSQEERRTATREALLDAALGCLLEEGYQGLTTRRVAARAGVSQGTQRFYFPSRGSFVAATIERLAIELAREDRLQGAPDGATGRERIAAYLDRLWEMSRGPIFQAMAELAAAAERDADVRVSLRVAEHAVTRQLALAVRERFPELSRRAEFRDFLLTALAAMRGLAMFAPTAEEDLEARWQSVRAQLLTLCDAVLSPPRRAQR
jgi:AcrR family transcriptional regulator